MHSTVQRFKGTVALVTHGASSTGRATCERLAAEGARVWVCDADPAAAREVTESLPHADVLELDTADPGRVQAAVDAVLACDGRLDVLVNASDMALSAPLWETTGSAWAQVLTARLTSTFHCCRAVLPHMVKRRGGAIVNVASQSGLVARPGQAASCAADAGIIGLTRAAAIDAGPSGVRVNCVCPAFPEPSATSSPRPAQIAAVIAYLASEEASFITGVALPVDGGLTAR